MKEQFYTGSYATADNDSIYEYELDTDTGSLKKITSIKGVDNPSYLLVCPEKNIMYTVEELTPEGRVAVFEKKQDLEYLFSLPSGGADPCHLSTDEDGNYLFISNYTSGSLSVYRLDEEGKPVKNTDHIQHKGHSVNVQRQEGPHVHFSKMADGELYVCDLGIDCIVRYHLDSESGMLKECGERIHFPKGFGPRHFALHSKYPEYLYVIGELTGEVMVLRKTNGSYERVQRISSLPEDFDGENTAAAIKFSEDGSLLFVSNRGSDTVTSFLVGADGTLQKADICPSGGKGPRDFEIFGDLIVAANQYTDNLAVLRYDKNTGKMQILSRDEKVIKPVMIEKK